MTYAELQVTTNYSFLRGASHPEELFAQARALGLSALGVTDRSTLAGIVRCHETAREVGLRLVVGCRVDEMVRTALYQAAHVLLHHGRWSSLRSWAMRIAKRGSVKGAKVALARRLAVVMHRM